MAARAVLGLVLIWLLLIAVNLWSKRERPPHVSLKLLHSALHDYLNTHGLTQRPESHYRDLIQSQPDLVDSYGVHFTLFDDAPSTAFRWTNAPWVIVTPESYGSHCRPPL